MQINQFFFFKNDQNKFNINSIKNDSNFINNETLSTVKIQTKMFFYINKCK